MTELTGTLIGMAVLAIAALLVAAHYRREYVRKQLLRRMNDGQCWDALRHRR
ncbi:gas vesicle protein [Paraburkholderia bryophila]|uniref:Gas vesicle protein n=1 Tax=Paraburkholderia bryophila TaxID=420952 RepID=A0A7Y9WDI4_9BURK|nr:gas vesicle protein [Paraburkholderia bryophila]